MKKYLLFLLLLAVLCPLSIYSQDDDIEGVEITSVKANIRGTPDAQGIVVITAVKGDNFELITNKGGWYLVQTPKYVGWIHGSTIKLVYLDSTNSEPPPIIPTAPKTPQRTTKTATQDSPFEAEYVGTELPPDISIKNQSEYNLTLILGGAKYSIRANQTISVTLDGGNYEYDASAPGVRSKSGVAQFSKGYRYSWVFYVKTVYR